MSQRSQNPKRQLWAARLRRYQLSGLSAAEYCRSHGLPPASFFQWKAKLTQAEIEQADPNCEEASRPARGLFVPVSTLEVLPPASELLLTLPGGTTVAVSGAISKARLAELFAAAIRASHCEEVTP